MKAIVLLKLFILSFLVPVKSQSVLVVPEVVNASGGTFNNGNYIFEWSIGELSMVETFSKNETIVTCGFFQPVVKKRPSNPPSEINIEFDVYPNPVTSTVTVQFTGINGNLQLVLTDATGKVLQKQQYLNSGGSGNYSFNMSPYARGNYFLTVSGMQANGLPYFKTHKLVKL